MYRQAMIGQTRVRTLGVVGVIAIPAALALIVLLLNGAPSDAGQSVLTGSSHE
jgi:hypothetical protein